VARAHWLAGTLFLLLLSVGCSPESVEEAKAALPQDLPEVVVARLDALSSNVRWSELQWSELRIDVGDRQVYSAGIGRDNDALRCLVLVQPFRMTEEAIEAGLPDLKFAPSTTCNPADLVEDEGLVISFDSSGEHTVVVLLPASFHDDAWTIVKEPMPPVGADTQTLFYEMSNSTGPFELVVQGKSSGLWRLELR